MILAIDTATGFAGLALYDQDSLWAEEIWYARQNHTVELAPRLHRMLTCTGVEVAALQGIVVCIGPGSYTGVRIGVAIAKGLALPHAIPLVGIQSLAITAQPHQSQPLPVLTIARAGRNRILTACYGWDARIWRELQPPTLTTLPQLIADLPEAVLITGEISAAEADLCRQQAPAGTQIAGPLYRVRRPGILAEMGASQLANGYSVSPDKLVPVYLKNDL